MCVELYTVSLVCIGTVDYVNSGFVSACCVLRVQSGYLDCVAATGEAANSHECEQASATVVLLSVS